MIKINQQLLNTVLEGASNNPRKRLNYNFHTDFDDPIQRMLNCIEPGSYFRPHKHADPPKREAFIILQGKAVVIQFDDNGKIEDHFILDSSVGNYGIELPENKFHTIIIKETTVIYELKDGPYTPIKEN